MIQVEPEANNGPGGNHMPSRVAAGTKTREPIQEPKMGKHKPDMIKGTLDMLILKILSIEPMHGWGVSERIQHISKDALQVNQGSLYASLHKLTREGWIRSYWEVTENNRRARYYALTRAGEKQLGIEAEHWDRLAEGVARVMAIS
jgi:transcriptional regulator